MEELWFMYLEFEKESICCKYVRVMFLIWKNFFIKFVFWRDFVIWFFYNVYCNYCNNYDFIVYVKIFFCVFVIEFILN